MFMYTVQWIELIAPLREWVRKRKKERKKSEWVSERERVNVCQYVLEYFLRQFQTETRIALFLKAKCNRNVKEFKLVLQFKIGKKSREGKKGTCPYSRAGTIHACGMCRTTKEVGTFYFPSRLTWEILKLVLVTFRVKLFLTHFLH